MVSNFRRFYHGVSDDQIGQVGMFLRGQGRYKVIWDNGRISEDFGIVAGLSKNAVEEVIRLPTLCGKKQITGRQILLKAKAVVREAKVLLAYWVDYTRNGGFPSGKNEDDALEYVREQAANEHEQRKERDDEDNDDDDDEELSQPRVPGRNNPPADSDSEIDEEFAPDENNEVEEVVGNSSHKYYPPAMLTFMLMGPYGKDRYGFDVSPLFSMDTDAIEELAKTGSLNVKSIKEEKKKEDDVQR